MDFGIYSLVFFPQHFVFGSPFLLSLSAYTCNAGTHDFYPPLSTGPMVVIAIPPQPVTFPWDLGKIGNFLKSYFFAKNKKMDHLTIPLTFGQKIGFSNCRSRNSTLVKDLALGKKGDILTRRDAPVPFDQFSPGILLFEIYKI